VHFLDIFIRQAHPGPCVPSYSSYEQKLEDARIYTECDCLPWQVLVDDLAGSVHQAYGGPANPSYVISSEGRISFYNIWTHAPSLHRALEELTSREAACVVRGGIDKKLHIMAMMVAGWPAIERGLPQSFSDLESTLPGSAYGLKAGYKLKPALSPIALRARPLSTTARAAMGGAGLYIGTRLLR
jgi:hypothetical protein